MSISISIIVPVYNGEKHIEKCIKNVLNQSYENFELLVINDGSKDNTGAILEKLKKVDERIKVINKKNTGVSDTRNIGIKMATGDYIMFLDSDDCLKENALNEIILKLNNNNSEIMIFGFEVKGSNNRLNDTNVLKRLENNYNKRDIIESILKTKNNIFGYIWRAIYSRNYLLENSIEFVKGIKISEDYMFLLKSVKLANYIVIDSNEYYVYELGESSMSTKHIPSLLHDMMFVNDWVKDDIIRSYPNFNYLYSLNMCNTYLRFVQNTVRDYSMNFKEKISLIYKVRKEYKIQGYLNTSCLKYSHFTKKTYLSILMFNLYLEVIYVILFNLKERLYCQTLK